MDGKDRRQNPRFEGRFQVDLLNMGDDPKFPAWKPVVASEALDFSKHGMRLRSPYSVPLGSIISAVAYFKGHESVCLCEVMWRVPSEDQFMYGLFIREWSKLDPALKDVLDKMEAQEKKAEDAKGSPQSASASSSAPQVSLQAA